MRSISSAANQHCGYTRLMTPITHTLSLSLQNVSCERARADAGARRQTYMHLQSYLHAQADVPTRMNTCMNVRTLAELLVRWQTTEQPRAVKRLSTMRAAETELASR